MRLVDADLIEKQFDSNTWQGEMMIAIARGFPTAYDVDKVVSELKSHNNTEKMATVKLYNDEHRYYRAVSVTKAIKIVKGGGIE
jgi:hypothetical protein